jgi:hypothetical protein
MRFVVLTLAALGVFALLGYGLLSDYKSVKMGVDSYSCAVYNLPADCIKR